MSDSAYDERLKEVSTIRKAMVRPELGAICGAILVFAFFLLVAGNSGMFSPEGIQNWTLVSAQFAIIAVGACLLMIAGEFDLSVGSMIGFAGIIIAILAVQWGWPVWLSTSWITPDPLSPCPMPSAIACTTRPSPASAGAPLA